MDFKDLNDYIIENFQNTTGDLEEINHIPHFPEPKGEHHTEIINENGIYVEIITNSAFPNYILFKIPIDNTWVFQRPKVYNFLRWFFNTNRNKRIISVRYHLSIDTDPYNCWAYFMVEFDS